MIDYIQSKSEPYFGLYTFDYDSSYIMSIRINI